MDIFKFCNDDIYKIYCYKITCPNCGEVKILYTNTEGGSTRCSQCNHNYFLKDTDKPEVRYKIRG